MTGFSARSDPDARPAAAGQAVGPGPAVPRLRPGADLRLRRRRPRWPALARRVPGHSCDLAPHEGRRGHDRTACSAGSTRTATDSSRCRNTASPSPRDPAAQPPSRTLRRRSRRTRADDPPRPRSRPSRRSSSRRRSGPSWRRNAASATRAPPRSCGAGSGSTAGRASASGGESGPAIVPGNPDESLLIQAIRYRDDELRCPPRRSSPTRSSPTSRPGSRWARPIPGPGRPASRRVRRSTSRRGGSSGRSGLRRSPPRRP